MRSRTPICNHCPEEPPYRNDSLRFGISPRYSSPFRRGDRYFYYYNDGLQNQFVLYKQDQLDADGEVLIDPNTFSEDGTVSMSSLAISDDGRYAAYAKSEGGSDWREFFVRDVQTGEDLDTRIRWVKFSGVLPGITKTVVFTTAVFRSLLPVKN